MESSIRKDHHSQNSNQVEENIYSTMLHPTENAELDEKEAFYSLLDKTLLGIKRSDIIVMM